MLRKIGFSLGFLGVSSAATYVGFKIGEDLTIKKVRTNPCLVICQPYSPFYTEAVYLEALKAQPAIWHFIPDNVKTLPMHQLVVKEIIADNLQHGCAPDLKQFAGLILDGAAFNQFAAKAEFVMVKGPETPPMNWFYKLTRKPILDVIAESLTDVKTYNRVRDFEDCPIIIRAENQEAFVKDLSPETTRIEPVTIPSDALVYVLCNEFRASRVD